MYLKPTPGSLYTNQSLGLRVCGCLLTRLVAAARLPVGAARAAASGCILDLTKGLSTKDWQGWADQINLGFVMPLSALPTLGDG